MTQWRFLDTGVLTAAENMALDAVILEAVDLGEAPPTIRYLQFCPPAVLVGYHQCVDQEVRISFCSRHGIDINRRITGGGAILFDETQLGWEVFDRADELGISVYFESFYSKMCQPVVRVLKEFGLAARFRPKNDIEIDGKKISGTGGTALNKAFMFQGTLLLDFDIDLMLKSLLIPVEKIQDKQIEFIAQRVTWLSKELSVVPDIKDLKNLLAKSFAEEFNIELIPLGLTNWEKEEFAKRLNYYQSEAWIYKIESNLGDVCIYKNIVKTKGGLIRVDVKLDASKWRISDVMITGDYFVSPSRAIPDLESALRGAKAEPENIRTITKRIFETNSAFSQDLTWYDFAESVIGAVNRAGYEPLGFSNEEVNKIFTINGDLEEIISKYKLELMFLPYCAKPVDCKYRDKDECAMCGVCNISDAYRLAVELNIKAKCIISFEHLMESLSKAKEKGYQAFVGCCCASFYRKHQVDMQEAGLPGILLDVENPSCFDLGEERKAYIGKFSGKTEINCDILSKLCRIWIRRYARSDSTL